ncbi:hypothetical protein A6U87_00770 [Rhizobium sp. AC44/96]|uniref:DUF805 domain-containing protein n=1 Tax=unclassified Rhizobium TaxID=2613769 RepID=UPI00081006F0|nr:MULTISPECIES: DUF805 domain-containing protein [unclassified Rhizobium]MDM9619237.1 DUF805 domain-containing protein [Rhizobium sp. S96]OCJ17514.1 hypothetical protein A6U87_00770 [Rhizobium sp. AC44/96]
MDFTEAVTSVFSNYAVFKGRARRSEFWWFTLFSVLASFVLAFVDYLLFGHEILSTLFALGTLLPMLAVTVRRLHDVDRSGWWIFIGLIPLIGAIILLYWYISEGTPGANQFGPPA